MRTLSRQAPVVATLLAALLLAACVDDGWYSRRTQLTDGDGDVFGDTDGDGIPDSVEGSDDFDGDGLPNSEDLDSDGDGVGDADEGSGDPDDDGIPSYLDDDSDGDGIPDAEEGDADTDGDGLVDAIDDDSDGDGLLDAVEGTDDSDGDGTPDYLDSDSDNDGIDDGVEGDGDPDGDGVPSYLDDDSDGDGWTDAEEGGDDPDEDGVPSSLDEDSDGDGWLDEEESDEDGDGDGLPDYLDDDSDGDGIPDAVDEDSGWVPGGGDDDDDGGGGGGDDDDDGGGGGGIGAIQLQASPDHIEPASAGTYTVTISNVGSGVVTGTIGLTPNQYPIFQLDGSSVFTVAGGDSTTRDVAFAPSAPADYSISFVVEYAPSGDNSTLETEAVLLTAGSDDEPVPEICNNTIDDDGDGLIDCGDPDCASDAACSTSDWCCVGGGDGSTSSLCWDAAAASCVCTADAWCCGGGWDNDCQQLYAVTCASTTCGS